LMLASTDQVLPNLPHTNTGKLGGMEIRFIY